MANSANTLTLHEYVKALSLDTNDSTVSQWTNVQLRTLIENTWKMASKPHIDRWDYYQNLIKENGYDGISDLLVKTKELKNKHEKSAAIAILLLPFVNGCTIRLEDSEFSQNSLIENAKRLMDEINAKQLYQ